MTKAYSRSDLELIARIAHEVEGITVGSSKEQTWADTEEYVKDEQLARLDRVLGNLDQSVFGKVARAVAVALDDAFLTEGSDAELTDAPTEEELVEGAADLDAEINAETRAAELRHTAEDEDAALNAELDAAEERHQRRLDETGVGQDLEPKAVAPAPFDFRASMDELLDHVVANSEPLTSTFTDGPAFDGPTDPELDPVVDDQPKKKRK